MCHKCSWPKQLNKCYVLTIRDERWNNAVLRLKPFRIQLIKYFGVIGSQLNLDTLKKEYVLGADLLKGEVGCYLGHLGIWKICVEKKIPYVLILEDDANITKKHIRKINKSLNELNSVCPNWDLFFLSRSIVKQPIISRIGKHLALPGPSYGAFAYALSFRGACSLLEKALPICHPLDVYLYTISHLKIFTIYPSLFFVTDVKSDTAEL